MPLTSHQHELEWQRLMIVYQLTPRDRQLLVLFSVPRILFGVTYIALLALAITGEINTSDWTLALVLVALIILSDTLYVTYRFIQLFVLGGVRVRIITTSTALAAKMPNLPARFIRKADCIAYRPASRTLVAKDGREFALDSYIPRNIEVSYFTDFLTPWKTLWWPSFGNPVEMSDRERIQLDLYSPKRTPETLLILLAAAVFGLSLTHSFFAGMAMIYVLWFPARDVTRWYFKQKRLRTLQTVDLGQEHVDKTPMEYIAELRAICHKYAPKEMKDETFARNSDIIRSGLSRKEKRRLILRTLGYTLAYMAGILTISLLKQVVPAKYGIALALVLAVLFIPAALYAFAGFWCVLSGDFYYTMMANSRTIALKQRGKPVRYRKRRDAIAIGGKGQTLIFRDGSSIPLKNVGEPYFPEDSDMRQMGLWEFYDKWWAGTTPDDIIRGSTKTLLPRQTRRRRLIASLLPLFSTLLVMAVFGVHILWFLISFFFLGLSTILCVNWLRITDPYTYYCPMPLTAEQIEHVEEYS